MLISGVEEPLQENEQLQMLDEGTGEIVLSRAIIADLNRYVFAWSGDVTSGTDRFSSLLEEFQRQAETGVTWLSTWTSRADGVDLSIRARRIASARSKGGWVVSRSDDLFVSAKRLEHPTKSELGIDRFQTEFEGRLLFYGRDLQPEELLLPSTIQSIRLLATWRKFAPSEQFLSWLAAQQLTIVYRINDERGFVFLVMITPRRVDIAGLMAQGYIDQVRIGPEAGLVWRSLS